MSFVVFARSISKVYPECFLGKYAFIFHMKKFEGNSKEIFFYFNRILTPRQEVSNNLPHPVTLV